MGDMSMNKNSDKYFKAERRNKLERSRLELTSKYYDKEAFRIKYSVDREKRLIFKNMGYIQRCSGTSKDGVAPIDGKDKEYTKSPVYTNGFRLSNERLTKWRNEENNMIKMLRREVLGKSRSRTRGYNYDHESKSVNGLESEFTAEDSSEDENDDKVNKANTPFLRFIKLVRECKSGETYDDLGFARSEKIRNDMIINEIKNIKVSENDTVWSLSRKNNAISNMKKMGDIGLHRGETPSFKSGKKFDMSKQISYRPHTSVNTKRTPSSRKSAVIVPIRPETAPGELNNPTGEFVITRDRVFMKCSDGYKVIDIPLARNNDCEVSKDYKASKDKSLFRKGSLVRQTSSLFKRAPNGNTEFRRSSTTQDLSGVVSEISALGMTDERPSSRQEGRENVKFSNDVSSFKSVFEVLRAAQSFSKSRRQQILKRMVNDNNESDLNPV